MRAAAAAALLAAAAAGQCPVGSLDACIAACPASPVTVYEACVKSCGKRCPAPAPPAPPAPAPPPAPSPPGLDDFIMQQMRKGRIPGLSAAVLHNDSVVWSAQYGSADPAAAGGGPPVGPATVFTFASVSKTLIAAAVLRLRERGWLDAGDEISALARLPYRIVNPKYPSKNITVHGLLTHTSSIVDGGAGGSTYEGDPKITLAAFFRQTFDPNGGSYSKRSFASWAPQTRYEYSNIGATLLAYIAERVAAQHGLATGFDELVRQDVMEPLGVAAAGFYVRDFGGEAALAPPAGALPSEWTGRKYNSYCFYSYPDYADGTFKASALSYARLFGALINGGSWQGTQVLSPASIAYMRGKAVCAAGPCGEGHGRPDVAPQGLALLYYEHQFGREVLGHSGGDAGIANEAFFNPATGVGYVVLSNGDWGAADDDAFSRAFFAIEERLLDTFEGRAGPARAPGQHAAPRRRRGRAAAAASAGGGALPYKCEMPY